MAETDELRKQIFFKSNSGKQKSTETKMEKTASELNLTRPSLDGIYNDNSFLDLEKDNEEVSEYIAETNEYVIPGRRSSIDSSMNLNSGTSKSQVKAIVLKSILFALKLCAMAASAYCYNRLTREIHNSHIKTSPFTYEALSVTNIYLSKFFHNLRPFSIYDQGNYKLVDDFLVLVIQGLIMGLTHPLMDRLLPASMTKRLLSSNPNSLTPDLATLLNDLVRALVTFMGISYAVRKVDWNASLQVLIIWSLLNPFLWLILDGTISGLISSVAVAVFACLCMYVQIGNSATSDALKFVPFGSSEGYIAVGLWISSFFFCGAIIFGKLGRALFPK